MASAQGAVYIWNCRAEKERGAGRLLDKVARKILENATHQHELTQIASEIGQYLGWTPGGMATDHERGGK